MEKGRKNKISQNITNRIRMKHKQTTRSSTTIIKKRSGKIPELIKMQSREFILQCMDGHDGLEQVIRKVYLQAKKGSFKHQELLMNYLLGKPVEKLKLEGYMSASNTVQAPTVLKIIADNLRLEKLHKDVEHAVVDHERIAAMEAILNVDVVNGDSGEDSIKME